MRLGNRPLVIVPLFIALCFSVPRVHAGTALDDSVFAVVGGVEITGREYLATLRNDGRRKFYHGQPPEEELAAFRRRVGEQLIDRQLLLLVAGERRINPDRAWVEERLQQYVERLDGDPDLHKQTDVLVPRLRERLTQESRIERLEATIRDIPDPSVEQITAFYREHADLFTTPERFRVSVIMLRVPPWAGAQEWEEARLRAQSVWAQIREGGQFEDLAKLHSQDPSAQRGGDLGFLHRDMLGGGAQGEVEKLEVGQHTEPVRLLEGYALLKLSGREPPRLNDFDSVRERAALLWQRETSDGAWKRFLDELRRDADVLVNERYYELSVERLLEQIDSEDRLLDGK